MLNRPNVPFEGAFDPLIDAARSRLVRNSKGLARLLGAGAIEGVLRGLEVELSYACSPAALAEFATRPGRRWLDPQASSAYDGFVSHLAHGGLESLMAQLPELGTAVDAVTIRWERETRKFLERLGSDLALLRREFGVVAPLQQCERVTDTVLVLDAPRAQRIVYKSRALSMDRAWSRVLGDLNGKSPSLLLYRPTILDRDQYGWMEWLAPMPPQPHREHRYWHRAGMLLCVIHALGGGDVHSGNVRMYDEQPVIIDAEVLLRPSRAGSESLIPSALTTGWLPTPTEASRCGLATPPLHRPPQRWQGVGTDSIRRRSLRLGPLGIRPATSGFFARHRTAMIQNISKGFAEMYAVIAGRGVDLEPFRHATPRVLLRSSHTYQTAIEASLDPKLLGSRDDRLGRVLLLANEPPHRFPPASAGLVQQDEVRRMMALEVPRYTMGADDRNLDPPVRAATPAFRLSPLQRASSMLSRLSTEAMHQELETIREVIHRAADNTFLENMRFELQPVEKLV